MFKLASGVEGWYFKIMVYYDREPIPQPPQFSQVNFEEESAYGIKDKFDMMQAIVNNCIRYEHTEPKRIATIQNNLHGRESFYLHSAVLMMLESRGLIDDFYNDNTAYKEIDNGWQVTVSVPLAGTKFKEQFKFISKDGLELGDGSKHIFALFYQLKRY